MNFDGDLTPELEGNLDEVVKVIRSGIDPSTYYFGKNNTSIPMSNIPSRAAQSFLSSQLGSIAVPAFTVFLASCYLLHTLGASGHTVTLLVGGAISVGALFTNAVQTIFLGEVPESRPLPSRQKEIFVTFLGVIPYGYSLYLIIQQGFVAILESPSGSHVLLSVFFILAGHWIARKARIIQEFHSIMYGQAYERVQSFVED